MSRKKEIEETDQYWLDHWAAWKASGLSQKAYCNNVGIKLRGLVYSGERLRAKQAISAVNFIEVEEQIGPPPAHLSPVLQIMLPNGVRIGITAEANKLLICQVMTAVGSL